MTWARLVGGERNGTVLDLPDFVVNVKADGEVYHRAPTMDRYIGAAAYTVEGVRLRGTRRALDADELRKLTVEGMRDGAQLEEWLRFQIRAAYRADHEAYPTLSEPIVTIWRSDRITVGPAVVAEAEWLVGP